jgi:hypothetical protein
MYRIKRNIQTKQDAYLNSDIMNILAPLNPVSQLHHPDDGSSTDL